MVFEFSGTDVQCIDEINLKVQHFVKKSISRLSLKLICQTFGDMQLKIQLHASTSFFNVPKNVI